MVRVEVSGGAGGFPTGMETVLTREDHEVIDLGEYRQIDEANDDDDDFDKELETEHEKRLQPWFVLPVVVCATVAISAAGAMTKLMKNAAPISQAGWRLQLTSLVLLPGFIWQCYRMTDKERRRCLRWTNVGVIVLSSISLAFHFGLWGETIGVALGVGGSIIIVAGSKVEKDLEVTMLGDMAAFLAAVAFVAYISAGKHLRGWMPLYVYAFPVTAGAAVSLTLAGMFSEGVDQSSSGNISGPFAWLRKEYLLLNLGLALGPGFVGHTGFNVVLRYCTALLVAMATTMEPLLGSIMGWLVGVSGVPGLSTLVGGAVMLLGTLWVSLASEQQQQQQQVKESESTDND